MSTKCILHQFEIGPMDNFMYIIGDPLTKKCAIIDPGWDADIIMAEVKKTGCEVESVILTHGHYDHCNALSAVLDQVAVPVYISEKEAAQLTPDVPGLIKTKDRDVIRVGDLNVHCYHTPGHSPGGQCLYAEPHLITGDTLFVYGCGRCDLPGSDIHQMYHSLYHVISAFPDETIIYPGHNYGSKTSDTIASQKVNNPYMTARSESDFISARMG